MIKICITNPFGKTFKHLGFIFGKVNAYKSWEIEHYIDVGCILDFEIEYTTMCDHAGLSLNFGILGYKIHASIYDTRHWDYDNNTWVKYDANY